MGSTAHVELLEIVWRAMLRGAIRLCCIPEDKIEQIQWAQRRDRPRLICYLDGLSDEVVKRQLEIRKKRHIEREASHTSLSSLAVVSEVDELSLNLPTVPTCLRKNWSTPAMSELTHDFPIPTSRSRPQMSLQNGLNDHSSHDLLRSR